jgi:two-component system, response regulator YesN
LYKLLIVDDETWVRERLKHTIKWSDIGLEVIGEAEDGEEALALTEALSPDIVITDIRMPCINGLEYIKKLRDNHNDTKFIIISGYSDFEYAQRALKLGAYDYILKPIEDDDLIGVVKRCVEEINSNKNKDNIFKKAKEQIEEGQTILKEKFFINLINGYFSVEEDILRELDNLNMEFNQCKNICFIVELDDLKTDNIQNKKCIQVNIYNVVRGFLKELNSKETFCLRAGDAICLVISDSDEATLSSLILSISKDIKKSVKEITNCSVTIGIGRVYGNLTDISKSYREAKEALQYKAYMGNDKIYEINSVNTDYKSNYYKFKDLEILINNIKLGNKESSLSTLSNMLKETQRDGDIYPIDLKFLYIDIVNSVFKTILNIKTSAEDFSDFSFKFFKQMNFLQTVDETYIWLSDTIIKIIDTLESYKNIKKRKIIEKALEYINNHYTEQITLNNVSDVLFMNASYFCKIFREEMGEPFTKYFINLRIQKAKELMTDPTLKIYEIAGMVGYTDVQYFTKIFKSIQGVTPMQYREKIK